MPHPSSPQALLRFGLILFAASGLLGCQTEKSAMQMVCDAPKDCEPCQTADAAERQRLLAIYISDRLKNRSVQKAFAALASTDPATGNQVLRDYAKELGIESCPFAEMSPTNEEPSAEGAEGAASKDASTPNAP